MDKHLTEQITQKTTDTTESSEKNMPVPDTGADIAQNFNVLPIESLISKPLIAAAKGQQELASVYLNSPVINNDRTITMKNDNIPAPLLSLVPIPAFNMDEITVNFEMEVKTSETPQDQTKSESDREVNDKSVFGINANITGTISSDSLHKRQTDSTAKYNINRHATQQPPSEGMNKLSDLFSQMMEPLPKENLPE